MNGSTFDDADPTLGTCMFTQEARDAGGMILPDGQGRSRHRWDGGGMETEQAVPDATDGLQV
jgi:hypothetical protein